MRHYEFSLVLFTVLVQFSAGLSLLVWLTGLCKHPAVEKLAWRIILACGAVGLAGATMHLANMLNAPYSLTQVGSSWLSREIVAVALFGTLVLLRVLGVLGSGANAVPALAGTATVFVVAQVYKVAAVPFWNTVGTDIGFAGTALALGGAGLVALVYNAKLQHEAGRIVAIATAACVAGIVLSVAQPLLGLQGGSAALPEGALLETLDVIRALGLPRLLAAVAGGGMLCFAVLQEKKCSGFVMLAFALILAGEVAGRMLFYAANIKVGI